MTSTRTSPPLLDALYELSLAQQVPDATILEDVIARYPEHAEALTAFAIELAMDADYLSQCKPEHSGHGENALLRLVSAFVAKDGEHHGDSAEEGNEASVATMKISPAVSRAMSRYQNRLHAAKPKRKRE